MNDYFFKIKRIVFPVLAGLLAIAAGYGLSVWLLLFGFPEVPVKKEALQAYLPMLLGSLFFLFALSKRFRIIDENSSVQMGWRGWLQMLTWFAVLAMMILSYDYVRKRFAVLADVVDAGQVDSRSTAGYYRIADLSVQPGRMGSYVENRTIPKRAGSDIQFTVYAVFPFMESENAWYALNYSKTVDRGSDERLQRDYAAFLEECDKKIGSHDFTGYHLFEKVPASDDRDGFVRAIERATGSAPAAPRDIVILRPLADGYPGQGGVSLCWIFLAVGIWLLAMLPLLYYAPLNYRLLNTDLTLRKKAENKDDDFPGLVRSVLIPGPRSWPVVLFVDAILVYFAVMTVGGVNPLSSSSQELFEWGALRSVSLREGEWWRVVTSMFMHANVLHLVSNLVALGVASFFAISLFKAYKTAVIFFVSGVCADTAAAWFFEGTYVGASGAVMGLMGAILAVYSCYRKSLGERAGLWWIAGTAALTLLLGIQAGISNTAHIVGLFTGAALGLLLFTPPPPKRRRVAKRKPQAGVPEYEEVAPGGETVVVRTALSRQIKLLLI
ncbi:MAG: rhomboid family intramembrane serine protease, partial [Parabacteroides sp.]|nr:rhomboid family intramembrane serine protease [Parabacteroides sp.]